MSIAIFINLLLNFLISFFIYRDSHKMVMAWGFFQPPSGPSEATVWLDAPAVVNWSGTWGIPEGQCQHGLSPDRFEAIGLNPPSSKPAHLHSPHFSALPAGPLILTDNSCCWICYSWQKPGGPQSQDQERRRSERRHPPTPRTQQRKGARGYLSQRWVPAGPAPSCLHAATCRHEKPVLQGHSRDGHIPKANKWDFSFYHVGINQPSGLNCTVYACISSFQASLQACHWTQISVVLTVLFGGLASVSKMTDRYTPFSSLSYPCLQEFLPVGFQVEENTSPGSGEGGPPHQQDQKDDVRKGGCHPHHLWERKHGLSSCGCWCLLFSKISKKGDLPLFFLL